MKSHLAYIFRSILLVAVTASIIPACSDDKNEPAANQQPVISPAPAMVFGEAVSTTNANEVQEIILTELFDRYAQEQGIVATEDEIDAFVDTMSRDMRNQGLTAEDSLTPEEAEQAAKMRREMARSMIRQWKLNQALYQQYGGRVIYQQLGPEPLDAYRQFLEERQAAGDFAIQQESLKQAFWKYFTDDSMHDFYEAGSEAEKHAFSVPPWKADIEKDAESSSAKANSLTDTHWQLVRFQSMDDAVGEIMPEDSSAYTMKLNADGSVQMRLNCNQATGSWKSEPASDGISGNFIFGQMATTMALCPPPSMDERIAKDLQWVRGFLLRDGQLHLSLMADGGIYSWKPISESAGDTSFITKPDPALEDALRAASPDYTQEIVNIDGREGRYVYGQVDLNGDGQAEVMALMMGSIFCGTGGCTLFLFSQSDDGYSLINSFPTSRLPVIASPEKSNGWQDLVFLKSGGGVAPHYVRYAFNEKQYKEQEQLKEEPDKGWTRLFDGEYSYATGFSLMPGKK